MSSETAASLPFAGTIERFGEGRRPMDEREFQIFYAQTCRPLLAYLRRTTRDAALADDLLQETYYRFLKVNPSPADVGARRGYLFRIAANLVHDHFRRLGRLREVQTEADQAEAKQRDVGLQADLDDALATLDPKDQTRLWLAYVHGSSHREIAAATGVKEASVRPLLLRARRRLAALLRKRGFGSEPTATEGEA